MYRTLLQGPAAAAAAAAAALACVLACAACAPAGPPPAAEPPRRSAALSGYQLAAGPITIAGVEDNASGLAWCPPTGTLFLAVNQPPRIVELAPDGATRRIIRLRGFSDTEGIAHVRDGIFVVAEEARRTLVTVRITPATRQINYADCPTLLLDAETGGNQGLEGVAYDPAGRRLFGVKEKRPRKVYEVAEPTDDNPAPAVTNPWDAQEQNLDMRDLSGLCYHADSGHLLILSDESRCVVECTTDGREVSRLSLRGLGSGKTPPKPEGIAMDESGTLYICSEPNLLYVLKPTRGAAGPPAPD